MSTHTDNLRAILDGMEITEAAARFEDAMSTTGSASYQLAESMRRVGLALGDTSKEVAAISDLVKSVNADLFSGPDAAPADRRGARVRLKGRWHI